jgi:hypothetical protein
MTAARRVVPRASAISSYVIHRPASSSIACTRYCAGHASYRPESSRGKGLGGFLRFGGRHIGDDHDQRILEVGEVG